MCAKDLPRFSVVSGNHLTCSVANHALRLWLINILINRAGSGVLKLFAVLFRHRGDLGAFTGMIRAECKEFYHFEVRAENRNILVDQRIKSPSQSILHNNPQQINTIESIAYYFKRQTIRLRQALQPVGGSW